MIITRGIVSLIISAAMLAIVRKCAAPRTAACRSISSQMRPWDLFSSREAPVAKPATPLLINMTDSLEFALERMRLTERTIALQLLNRDTRRLNKANHGKRPCSHHRKRFKRFGRRSDK